MMITHLSPAKAIRAVLLLSTTVTAIGSTRNIVQKNEEHEPHRALMATAGLNGMDCHESVDTNDGSIVCTFRVMPPAATTTSNNPKLIHDCLFTSGSNFCITTEIYRATYDQANQATANQQTTAAANQNPPPLVTVDVELSSAIFPANNSPTPPVTVVMPSRTETIQIPTPVNGPNCPTTAPSNGSACSWVNTNQYSAFQCGYLSSDAVPQRPGTFINVCKCDAADRFVCGPAVDQIYNRVDATNNTPPLATIDVELNSAVIPPAAVPVAGNTIVNGDHCPSTVPSSGDTCSWVNNNPPKFSAYQCGYLTAGNGNTSNTFIMVCKCDANDTFVCASAGSDVYFNQSF